MPRYMISISLALFSYPTSIPEQEAKLFEQILCQAIFENEHREIATAGSYAQIMSYCKRREEGEEEEEEEEEEGAPQQYAPPQYPPAQQFPPQQYPPVQYPPSQYPPHLCFL